MNCHAARRLIDQGKHTAGQYHPTPALTEHLATCSACQVYQATADYDLLNQLLSDGAAPRQPAPPANPYTTRQIPLAELQPVELSSRPSRQTRSVAHATNRRVPTAKRSHPILSFLAALVLGVILFVVGNAAYSFVSIQRSMAAMALPTPAMRISDATREPTFAIPTDYAVTAVAQATSQADSGNPVASPVPTQRRIAPGSGLGMPEPLDPQRTPVPAPPTPPISTPTLTPVALGLQPPANATPALALLPTLLPGSENVKGPPSGSAITILMLGIDQRPGETDPVRADALMLVRIDPEQRRVALLSLPRDLIVNIPGYGFSRINAAHSYGDLYPELGGGIELTKKTVNQFLGIKIDYVVRIDFMAFIAAVDAIGGVEIYVEKEIYDPSYPTMDYRYQVVHFLPGLQQMDGEQALIYGRTRHADSDWERQRRQQQIILAAITKVRRQNLLGQMQSATALVEQLSAYIKTDLTQDRMLGLAWAFRGIQPDQIERYSLDANMVSMGLPGDPYAQYPLPGAAQQLANQLIYGTTP